MYEEHPNFKQPENKNIIIWRYIDFTKFVNILDTSTLFFARADRLGDPFEGSYPQANIRQREKVFKALLDKLPKERKESFKQFPLSEADTYRLLKKLTFINSWHESEYESAAMWQVYVKNNEGIAIQSTLSRLRDCFTKETPSIHISEVQYIDYDREAIPVGNVFYPFLHKRKSFEYEHELRAVFQQWRLLGVLKSGGTSTDDAVPEYGMPVSVNLNRLIDKIYVAPMTPDWLFELVKSIVKKYMLKKRVLRSAMDAKPVY